MIEQAIVEAANGAATNPNNFAKGVVTASTVVDGKTLVTVAGRMMVAIDPPPLVGQWVIWSRNPPFVLGPIAGG